MLQATVWFTRTSLPEAAICFPNLTVRAFRLICVLFVTIAVLPHNVDYESQLLSNLARINPSLVTCLWWSCWIFFANGADGPSWSVVRRAFSRHPPFRLELEWVLIELVSRLIRIRFERRYFVAPLTS